MSAAAQAPPANPMGFRRRAGPPPPTLVDSAAQRPGRLGNTSGAGCLAAMHGIARPRPPPAMSMPTGGALSRRPMLQADHGFACTTVDGSLPIAGLDQPRAGLGGAELPPFFQTVRVPVDALSRRAWEAALTGIPRW